MICVNWAGPSNCYTHTLIMFSSSSSFEINIILFSATGPVWRNACSIPGSLVTRSRPRPPPSCSRYPLLTISTSSVSTIIHPRRPPGHLDPLGARVSRAGTNSRRENATCPSPGRRYLRRSPTATWRRACPSRERGCATWGWLWASLGSISTPSPNCRAPDPRRSSTASSHSAGPRRCWVRGSGAAWGGSMGPCRTSAPTICRSTPGCTWTLLTTPVTLWCCPAALSWCPTPSLCPSAESGTPRAYSCCRFQSQGAAPRPPCAPTPQWPTSRTGRSPAMTPRATTSRTSWSPRRWWRRPKRTLTSMTTKIDLVTTTTTKKAEKKRHHQWPDNFQTIIWWTVEEKANKNHRFHEPAHKKRRRTTSITKPNKV